MFSWIDFPLVFSDKLTPMDAQIQRIIRAGTLKVSMTVMTLAFVTCAPAGADLSMELDLKTGQVYNMAFESEQIFWMSLKGGDSTEASIVKWELNFNVAKVEADAISLNITITDFSIVADSRSASFLNTPILNI